MRGHVSSSLTHLLTLRERRGEIDLHYCLERGILDDREFNRFNHKFHFDVSSTLYYIIFRRQKTTCAQLRSEVVEWAQDYPNLGINQCLDYWATTQMAL